MTLATPAPTQARLVLRADRHNGLVGSGKPWVPVWTRCKFVGAVLIFLVFNLALQGSHLGKVRSTEFPEKTWSYWAIKDFLNLRGCPDVVFLGSSLMLVPIAGTDADYLNKRLDGSKHHRSVYFESAMRQSTGHSIQTFNLALPGEMPSDAYLINDFLLKGAKTPRLLVYGVGPRDFMDNLLPSPSATDPYRCLSKIGDVGPISQRMMPQPFDRLSFELTRLLYLYGRKTDISFHVGDVISYCANWLLPSPSVDKVLSTAERRFLLPEYRACELAPGEAYFRPAGAKEKAQFFDNLTEYRKRYKYVKWDTFVSQMEFFADLLDVAKSRGIQVIVVSMPITQLNQSLIQEYAYNAYRRSIHALSRAKDILFIDLMSSDKFTMSDFCDTVHLHAGGGKKMLDEILKALVTGQTPALMPGCIEEFSGGGNPRRTDLKNPDVAGGVS